MLKIYLAGDIAKEDRWRPKVMKALEGLPVEWLSPIDQIDYGYYRLKKEHEENKVFLFADYMKIDRADIVFAYLRRCDSRHSGTSAEIGYARAKGKFIIYINDMPKTEAYLYEFVQRTADIAFTKLRDGIEFLKDFVAEMNYLPEMSNR